MSDADMNAPREFAVIYFEDVDKRPEVFAGEGWQASARVRLARARDRWSCHLLYSEGVVAGLRAQLAAMHRRAQVAEAAAQVTVEDCRRQGVSLGRGLALAAWHAEREKAERLEADAARLDWLEGEYEREQVALVERTPMPRSLFRRNTIITRAAIDAARAAHEGATHDGA